jgi:hypothetical protein
MRRVWHETRENWLSATLLLAVLAVSTVFLLKPFYDNDFFWHLKTGEWIWQNGRLPDRDLFNFTTPASVTPAIRFTLTSYWLSQLTLYLAYLCSGMTGIVALRFIFTAVLFYFMALRLKGDRIVNASLLTLFTILILNFYFMERPQTLSFLYFGVLLFIIENIKRDAAISNINTRSPAGYHRMIFLALVMFLWSNSHGGHLIGQVTLLLFMVMEGVKFLDHRLNAMSPEGYVRLLTAGLTGLLSSLINPNTYQALLLMLQTNAGDPSAQIEEYSSMIEFYSRSQSPVVVLYISIMILTTFTLLAFPREIDITEVALLGFVGFYAFMHVRFAAFFPIAALPVLGMKLSNDILAKYTRKLLPPISLFMAIYTVSGEFTTNIATAKEGTWISDRRFPEKAADFVLANNLQGNMYNPYDWGGYLIWRLAPQRRVFADGRNLNADILLQNYMIETAQINGTGEPVWKTLLQKNNANYIVTHSRDTLGRITPLTNALLSDKEWVPVFLDRRSHSIIFVRNAPGNSWVIANKQFWGV